MDDKFLKSRPDPESTDTNSDNESEDSIKWADQGASESPSIPPKSMGIGATGSASQYSFPSRPSTKQSFEVVPARKGGSMAVTANPNRPVVDNMAAQGFF